MKKWLKYLGFFLLFALIASMVFIYVILLIAGKETYEMRAQQVNGMVAQYPVFFEVTFNEIFPEALRCQNTKDECIKNTRNKFDQLSIKPQIEANVPSNQKPIYFITLFPEGKIAKLFFSGDLKIEEVDNREERMVVEVLEGKRKELYGPYFGEEAFLTLNENGEVLTDNRSFKPAYLKDLYSQMEVIVSYYQDGKVVRAIVYLHGQ